MTVNCEGCGHHLSVGTELAAIRSECEAAVHVAVVVLSEELNYVRSQV